MAYQMFYEERENLSIYKYNKLLHSIKEEHPNYKKQEFKVVKLRFVRNGIWAVEGQDLVRFSLCLKDHKKIYLEKKNIQNQVVYESTQVITRKMADRILKGDIEWMKNHKKVILKELYLQMVINDLRPGSITIYDTETIETDQKIEMIIDKKIQKVIGGETNLFLDDFDTIQCLDESEYAVTYKRKAVIPKVLTNILQGSEVVYEPVMA